MWRPGRFAGFDLEKNLSLVVYPTERIPVNATKDLGWGDMLEIGEKCMQTPAGDNTRNDESWGSWKALPRWL